MRTAKPRDKSVVVPAQKIDEITEALVYGPRSDASRARRAAQRAESTVPRIGLKRAGEMQRAAKRD